MPNFTGTTRNLGTLVVSRCIVTGLRLSCDPEQHFVRKGSLSGVREAYQPPRRGLQDWEFSRNQAASLKAPNSGIDISINLDMIVSMELIDVLKTSHYQIRLEILKGSKGTLRASLFKMKETCSRCGLCQSQSHRSVDLLQAHKQLSTRLARS